MLYVRIEDDKVMDDRVSAQAFRLYAVLRTYCRDRGECWPSNGTLAKRTGMHVDVVRRRLAELEQVGWVTREERDGMRLIVLGDPPGSSHAGPGWTAGGVGLGVPGGGTPDPRGWDGPSQGGGTGDPGGVGRGVPPEGQEENHKKEAAAAAHLGALSDEDRTRAVGLIVSQRKADGFVPSRGWPAFTRGIRKTLTDDEAREVLTADEDKRTKAESRKEAKAADRAARIKRDEDALAKTAAVACAAREAGEPQRVDVAGAVAAARNGKNNGRHS